MKQFITIALTLTSLCLNLEAAPKNKHVNKYGHLACKKKFATTKISAPETASAKSALKDSQRIYDAHEIKTEYPEEVMNQARQLIRRGITTGDMNRRKDLRKEKFVTIDGKTTIDRDDAIFVSRKRNGNYILKVAVPDMANYIKPKSAIGEWIFSQATSHYLRDKVIHMLPRDLVSGLLSIDPGKDRLAFVYEVEYDFKRKRLTNFKVDRAIINSKKAYDYEEFQEKMNNEDLQESHEKHIVDLYRVLNKTRKKSISFPFQTELKADLNQEGQVTGFKPLELHESNHLIEVFMVSINSTGARFMKKHGIPGIFRGQESSNDRRVTLFFDTLKRIGHGLNYKEDLSVFENLQRAFDKIRNYKHPEVLLPLLFYVTNPAENSHAPSQHFYLNVKEYSFLTSPIRRVSDYWNQLMFVQYLEKNLHSQETFDLLRLQEKVIGNDNDTMSNAKKAENQWQRVKQVRLSDIEQGFGYKAIISREFAEHDLVFIPSKGLYAEVNKFESSIPKNPMGKTGKKVFIQISNIDYETGAISAEYR